MGCPWKMSSLILTFFAFSFLNSRLPVARAQANSTASLVEYYFVVKNTTFTKFCENRTVLTVNDMYPGPEIRVKKGQSILVNVQNDAAYGVTIHWHGVKQPRNPWSDGPENITQCLIQPGKNFTQEVIFSDEIGTVWWHAHSDWTRATVHGAIVVEPPDDEIPDSPFKFPNHTLVFSTWFNQDLKEISDIIALNGTNTADAAGYTLNGFPGDQVTCDNVSEPTYNITVKRGETYVLHIVNAAMHEGQYFGIKNHTLTVVARDGAYVKPFATDYVLLAPGQTMDVTFVADQNQSQYYMRFRYFDDSGVTTNTQNTTGYLIYSDATENVTNTDFPYLPNATDNTTAFKFTKRLRSLYSRSNTELPRGDVKRIVLDVQVDHLNCTGSSDCPSTGRQAASLNRISFAYPTNHSILEAYYYNISGVYNTSYLIYPDEELEAATYAYQGTNVIMLDYGDPVELVFQAIDVTPAGGHPLHLHGFSFFQVGMNNGTFDNSTDPDSYNLDDPPEMNTAVVFGSGWTAVRFFANNPGVWFFHCHFESHVSWGMATALIVKDGPNSDQKLKPPPAGMPSCGA
ncbi:hypothetical protein SLEP1_g4762 [Rubroshorea leprosula]|uniref:Laccase n=1 Tax=Rubroshorea leprosula TaxID=152421 RepID=A0AAV5HXJ0_9ROSI|nr:hypothetical protein SLEP1_g4762 [Rubroshorea leprosula]